MIEAKLSICPENILANLNKRDMAILDKIVSFSSTVETLFFTQEYIGKITGYGKRTVARAIASLKKMGLIVVRRRFNTSAFYNLSGFFSRNDVLSILHKFFNQFPTKLLHVTLLLSNLATYSEFVIGNIYINLKGSSMVDEILVEKVRGIILALNKRGAKLTNGPGLDLFAFPEAVLDAAIDCMKYATPRHPRAFFFEKCRQQCVYDQIRPDWRLVELLRDENFQVLKPGDMETYSPGFKPYAKPVEKDEKPKISNEEYVRKQKERQKGLNESFARMQTIDRDKELSDLALVAKDRIEKGEPVNIYMRIMARIG